MIVSSFETNKNIIIWNRKTECFTRIWSEFWLPMRMFELIRMNVFATEKYIRFIRQFPVKIFTRQLKVENSLCMNDSHVRITNSSDYSSSFTLWNLESTDLVIRLELSHRACFKDCERWNQCDMLRENLFSTKQQFPRIASKEDSSLGTRENCNTIAANPKKFWTSSSDSFSWIQSIRTITLP